MNFFASLRPSHPYFALFSENPYRHLLFARGYILSEKRFPYGILNWKVVRIANYYLMHDPSLQFEKVVDGEYWIALLGTAVDIHQAAKSAREIAEKLLSLYRKSNDDFYQYLDVISGRFIVIYGDKVQARLLQDATGMRSAFYTTHHMLVASHCNLINLYIEAEENHGIQLDWLKTYHPFYLPGNQTPYRNIFYLTPNTFLELKQMTVKRFFPRDDLPLLSVDDIVESVSASLESQIVSLAKNNQLIFGLTGGIDSRTTLALSRSIKDQALYFTYFKSGIKDNDHMNAAVLNVDRQVATEIASNLDLKHLVLEINYDRVSEQAYNRFVEIQRQNIFIHHNYLLAMLYHEQLPQHGLHIRSTVTGIFKRIFRKATLLNNEEFTPDMMAFCYSKKAVKDPLVLQAFQSFYRQVNFGDHKNYDPYDLFYWEYRLGVWHSSLLLESDVAHDTFVIYNAREIIQKMLSLPITDQYFATGLNRLITRHWPVLNYWGQNNTQTGDFHDPVFDQYGLKMKPYEIRSGSMVAAQRKLPVYKKVQENRAKFFLDVNNPSQGDYVDFIKLIDLEPGLPVMLSVLLRSPYENHRLKRRLVYKVLLDDVVIAEEDISDWKESNLIEVTWEPKRDQLKLAIRVEAVNDCELFNWGQAGTMLIERIQLAKIPAAKIGSIRSTSPYTIIYEKEEEIPLLEPV